MAKATAICTCSTCGEQFTVTSIRHNRKDADSWEEWASKTFTICPDCEQKEREARASELAAQAAEDGLPMLVGTPKQIVWVESLRASFIDLSDKGFQDALKRVEKYKAQGEEEYAAQCNEEAKLFNMTRDYILHRIDSASWWIDHRGDPKQTIFQFYIDNRLKIENALEAITTKEKEMPSDDNEVLTPEEAKYGLALVTVNKFGAEASYPKDELFRSVVKASGFTWDPNIMRWSVIATETNGSALDRAAEVISRLLNAGFSVRCSSAEAREKALSGTFKPFTTMWIREGTVVYKGWLMIILPRRYEREKRNKIYKAACKIKGSKYDGNIKDGVIVFPVAQHLAVEDFANIYGYSFTNAALQIISEYENAKLNAAKPIAPEKLDGIDVLAEILNSPDDIIPDLEDE